MQALRAVTSDAAWQNFEEDIKGSIEVGKYADFVVLAEHPLTIDPVKIKEIQVLETIVNDETIYNYVTADDMKELVAILGEDGEFTNKSFERLLNTQLTGLSHYEKKGSDEKVIKHTKNLKILLEHQKENEMISEKAYEMLVTDADHLLKDWLYYKIKRNSSALSSI